MQDALKYYQIRQLPLQRNQTQVKLQRKKTVTTTKATTTSTTKASTTRSTTTTPKPAETTTTEQQQILGSVNNNDEELLGARTTIKIKWHLLVDISLIWIGKTELGIYWLKYRIDYNAECFYRRE